MAASWTPSLSQNTLAQAKRLPRCRGEACFWCPKGNDILMSKEEIIRLQASVYYCWWLKNGSKSLLTAPLTFYLNLWISISIWKLVIQDIGRRLEQEKILFKGQIESVHFCFFLSLLAAFIFWLFFFHSSLNLLCTIVLTNLLHLNSDRRLLTNSCWFVVLWLIISAILLGFSIFFLQWHCSVGFCQHIPESCYT